MSSEIEHNRKLLKFYIKYKDITSFVPFHNVGSINFKFCEATNMLSITFDGLNNGQIYNNKIILKSISQDDFINKFIYKISNSTNNIIDVDEIIENI